MRAGGDNKQTPTIERARVPRHEKRKYESEEERNMQEFQVGRYLRDRTRTPWRTREETEEERRKAMVAAMMIDRQTQADAELVADHWLDEERSWNALGGINHANEHDLYLEHINNGKK
eukprot:jgi/Mesvir1/1484/Mv14467-RA.1